MARKTSDSVVADRTDTTATDRTERSADESESTGTRDPAAAFDFYARLVKSKILKCEDMDARYKYSTWLTVLRARPDDRLKSDYARLLLMALSRGGTPVAPFDACPPEEIEPVDGHWRDAARAIFFRDDDGRGPEANPPIATAVSDDRCEFAACQTMPDGVQCYYARSEQPLHRWNFNYGSASVPPEEAARARPLDWERSLAGVRKMSSGSSSSAMNSPNETKMLDPCTVLQTKQHKINVMDHFKWDDKSELTGETIPGSDTSVDWLINEHEKVQMEIDERMIRSFDKLYPDNFRLLVSPELLDGMDSVKPDRTLDPADTKMATSCAIPQRAARNIITGSLPRQSAGSGQHSSEDNRRKRSRVYDVVDDHPEDRPENLFPTYVQSMKSLNGMANKAENIVKEVNDWLNTNRRKSHS